MLYTKIPVMSLVEHLEKRYLVDSLLIVCLSMSSVLGVLSLPARPLELQAPSLTARTKGDVCKKGLAQFFQRFSTGSTRAKGGAAGNSTRPRFVQTANNTLLNSKLYVGAQRTCV